MAIVTAGQGHADRSVAWPDRPIGSRGFRESGPFTRSRYRLRLRVWYGEAVHLREAGVVFLAQPHPVRSMAPRSLSRPGMHAQVRGCRGTRVPGSYPDHEGVIVSDGRLVKSGDSDESLDTVAAAMSPSESRASSGWHAFDPRRLLGSAFVYRIVQHAFAPRSSRRAFIEEYVSPRPGDLVLDVGCGPADDLEYMPDTVTYVGFDLSEPYIEAARGRWGTRGTFFQAAVSPTLLHGHEFDVVIANGVIHHLDDHEALDLLVLAGAVLKRGGRLITKDPVLVEDQHPVSRYLVLRDRGGNVRSVSGYRDLARRVFPDTTIETRNDMLRCPYDHAIMVARHFNEEPSIRDQDLQQPPRPPFRCGE
jgi:SAM-dependent methyltransferase